jgi:two-component system chemotaxis response regulator CheB
MEQAPTRIIVVCSPLGAIDDDLPYRAIQAGALELLAKPAVGRGTPAAFGEKLVQAIRLVATVPLAGARPAAPRARRPVPIEAFGLAASTGGPPALATILAGLEPSFGAPVFIAQHMAPGFARALASYLASVSSLPVHTVTAPTVGRAGHVYLPADEHDLEVDGEGVLRTRRSTGGHCPSGNRLLHSLASAFGERAGGVVLSGMGDDGASGLRAIRQRGGLTLVQDEASSAVSAMPRAALAAAAAAAETPLARLADAMRGAVK